MKREERRTGRSGVDDEEVEVEIFDSDGEGDGEVAIAATGGATASERALSRPRASMFALNCDPGGSLACAEAKVMPQDGPWSEAIDDKRSSAALKGFSPMHGCSNGGGQSSDARRGAPQKQLLQLQRESSLQFEYDNRMRSCGGERTVGNVKALPRSTTQYSLCCRAAR